MTTKVCSPSAYTLPRTGFDGRDIGSVTCGFKKTLSFYIPLSEEENDVALCCLLRASLYCSSHSPHVKKSFGCHSREVFAQRLVD